MRRVLFIVLLLSAGKIYAQQFEIGLKGGVNYAQSVIVNVVGTGGIDMQDVNSEKGMGLVFGGYARGTFGKWILEPSLLFSEDQQLVTLADANVQNMDLADFLSINVDKVDIPVLLGYKAFSTFRLMGGPVFSHVQSSSTDPLFQFSNMTMGYQAGVGFNISKMSFAAMYEGNLSKFKDYLDTDNGVIEVDSRKSLFQFTVAYKLF